MTDNRIKDRVKVMLNATTAPGDITAAEAAHVAAEPGHPNHALQVLTLAQRTADEHVNTAHRHADRIRAEAQAAAEQIVREAQAHVQSARHEADNVLAEARATADQAAREMQSRVEEAHRTAEKIVAEARAHADAVAASAAEHADELQQQAQRRYDDVVGGLSAKREALQGQIEALERFDHEYRARLTAFMQGQMRALWMDQPQVAGDVEVAGEAAAPEVVSAAVAVPLQVRQPEHEYEPELSEA